jgi:hypothetical protein
MKLGLFILSILGFFTMSFMIPQELQKSFDINHLIYVVLLAILLCNCVVGIMITYPEVFTGRRRFKMHTHGK